MISCKLFNSKYFTLWVFSTPFWSLFRYLTATEWANFFGGKRPTRPGVDPDTADFRRLPFDHCALSLQVTLRHCVFSLPFRSVTHFNCSALDKSILRRKREHIRLGSHCALHQEIQVESSDRRNPRGQTPDQTGVSQKFKWGASLSSLVQSV